MDELRIYEQMRSVDEMSDLQLISYTCHSIMHTHILCSPEVLSGRVADDTTSSKWSMYLDLS